MANPNKIKNGGTGTKLGNLLRNTVLSPNTLTPYTPKPTTQSVVPSGAGSTYKPPLSTPLPNMSVKPVYQGPQLTGGQSSAYQSNMTPLPTPTTSNTGNGTASNTSNTDYSGSSSYDTPTTYTQTDTQSKALPLGETLSGSEYGDIGNLYRDYMSGGDIVDSSAIRSRAIADVQDRINALNQVYDQQLTRVQREGVGRTGETTALLAARGLAGSMRGSAIADTTRGQNRQIEAEVDAQRNNAIQGILADANKAAMQEIQSKTEARLGGASALISFLKGSDERKQNYVNSVAQNLIASGVDLESMTPQQVQQLTQAAQKAGVSFNNIIAAYNMVKASQDTKDGFSLSSGQARYDAQGNLIAKNAGGAGEASSVGLSPEAQTIVSLINTSGGTIDDYIKGSSNAAQALRNEVLKGLEAQGGVTEKSTKLFQEAKAVIDDMIKNTDWKEFGISAKLGGKILPSYGDMVARASTVNAILARDNLGLLKGAMSDKDLAFIQSMSAGVPDGTISEKYAKERMEAIQKKLEEKVKQYKPQGVKTIEDYRAEFPQATQEELQALYEEEQGNLTNVGNTRASIPKKSRLAYVNNNPGNLRFVGQPGAVKGENGFAKFKTPDEGFNALVRQVDLDAKRGLTLAQFVNKYAPPTENDTNLYIKQMIQMTGATPNTPINNINRTTLAKAIAKKESGTKIV